MVSVYLLLPPGVRRLLQVMVKTPVTDGSPNNAIQDHSSVKIQNNKSGIFVRKFSHWLCQLFGINYFYLSILTIEVTLYIVLFPLQILVTPIIFRRNSNSMQIGINSIIRYQNVTNCCTYRDSTFSEWYHCQRVLLTILVSPSSFC